MEAKQNRGRPIASRDVCVTPEFRDEPDIQKLAWALIAIAKSLGEKKMVEDGKREGVP